MTNYEKLMQLKKLTKKGKAFRKGIEKNNENDN